MRPLRTFKNYQSLYSLIFILFVGLIPCSSQANLLNLLFPQESGTPDRSTPAGDPLTDEIMDQNLAQIHLGQKTIHNWLVEASDKAAKGAAPSSVMFSLTKIGETSPSHYPMELQILVDFIYSQMNNVVAIEYSSTTGDIPECKPKNEPPPLAAPNTKTPGMPIFLCHRFFLSNLPPEQMGFIIAQQYVYTMGFFKECEVLQILKFFVPAEVIGKYMSYQHRQCSL